MKIKYSALVSGARGKLNGSVASRNRYGDYFRNKTTPVNAQTDYQQNVRASLANWSRQWRGLSQEQREAWDALAESRPFTDIFGDQHMYSGFNLYIKVNQQSTVIGIPGSDNPPPNEPAPTNLGGIVLDSNTISQVGFSTREQPGTNDIIIVYGAANYSAGKKYVKNLYKYLGAFSATSIQPIDVTDELVTRFGDLQAGYGVSLRVTTFNTISRIMGTPYSASAVLEE